MRTIKAGEIAGLIVLAVAFAIAATAVSLTLWISSLVTMNAADVTMRVWRWCRELTIAQTIALFVVGLAMAAYFAGVYARAMKH